MIIRRVRCMVMLLVCCLAAWTPQALAKLIAEEDFSDYKDGAIARTQGKAGKGWKGPWRSVEEPVFPNPDGMIITSPGIQFDGGDAFNNSGKKMTEGFGRIVREFEEPLDHGSVWIGFTCIGPIQVRVNDGSDEDSRSLANFLYGVDRGDEDPTGLEKILVLNSSVPTAATGADQHVSIGPMASDVIDKPVLLVMNVDMRRRLVHYYAFTSGTEPKSSTDATHRASFTIHESRGENIDRLSILSFNGRSASEGTSEISNVRVGTSFHDILGPRTRSRPRSSSTARGITRIDGTTTPGLVAGLDGPTLRFVPDGSDDATMVPLSELREITLSTRSVRPTTDSDDQPYCHLELLHGDSLHGTLQGWEGRNLSLSIEGIEAPVTVPLDQITALWCGSDGQVKSAKAENLVAGDQDVAFVAQDEQVRSVAGIATGLADGALLFRYQDQERKINLSRLVGLLIGGTSETMPSLEFRQTVALDNGDVLTGHLTGWTEETVQLASAAAGPIALPLERVKSVAVRNGRMVWLTDLTPSKVEQVPYFDRVVPYRVNAALDGSAAKLRDGPTTRAVSMHSRTVLTYDIGGGFDEFRAKLGFQDPQGQSGRAATRVLGDGVVLYEHADARGDADPVEVVVPVKGVQQLTLEVDFGAEQDVGDWVVWGEPRLLREGTE